MEKNENGFSNLFPRTQGGDGCSRRQENGTAERMSDCNMEGRQLAMVYSPMQCWRMLKTPADALMSGTLFEELVKPYEEEW